MSDNLIKILNSVNKPTVIYESPDGTRLLLLPYGARILGLYAAGKNENFYWVNKSLENIKSAKTLFESEGWQNTGGDRTYLAPELDLFFPDYPKTDKHWIPPQLDASEYFIREKDKGIQMDKKMVLHFARPNQDVELELTKWVGQAKNPLRYEKHLQNKIGRVEYAGYTQRTTLKLIGEMSNNALQVGLWNLIQLPHGGDLIVPTYSKTQPLILFGDIPSEYLLSEPHCIRFKVCFPGEHKIAIRAAATTGRVGYVYCCNNKWSLVVRNFFVNPSGEYVDVPKNNPEDLGYSVNAVNVDSALGDFCELEYHTPAIGPGLNRLSGTDVSQVWAFRGNQKDIETITYKILGTNI